MKMDSTTYSDLTLFKALFNAQSTAMQQHDHYISQGFKLFSQSVINSFEGGVHTVCISQTFIK